MSLMAEFDEFEGISNQTESEIIIEDDDDDNNFKPVQASTLQANDVIYELEKRGVKSSGFVEQDKVELQKLFDEEFKADLEEAKARRRESKRRAALQAGIQKRRMLIEKTLQEEQDELSKNIQISILIDFIKQNKITGALRVDTNSVCARTLSKAMIANNSVTCLDLSSNNLNDHAGTYLAHVLKKNTTLKRVELDNNNLGSKSCVAFGNSLKVNTTLVYLSLDSNPIFRFDDVSSMKVIVEALRVNKTLTSFNLWRTNIGVIVGAMLASGIEDNETILFCDVGQNGLNLSDIKRITDKLDLNLASYEATLRSKKATMILEKENNDRIKASNDANQKQLELASWLDSRREARAESKRNMEEERILQNQAEMEDRKKRLADEAAAAKKAAAEAAAKKGDKKKKK